MQAGGGRDSLPPFRTLKEKRKVNLMTSRTMLCACANDYSISIRTVSAKMRSPHWFYISYGELDRLQRDSNIIVSDIRSFVQIRLDEWRDRIVFGFTWLSGRGNEKVEGTEQTVTLRWSGFKAFLDECRQPGAPKSYKALSIDTTKSRPRIIFDGNRDNLKAVIKIRHIRHKLAKALMANFCWPDSDEIRLYNDFAPHSFFFREIRRGQAGICGGLILHDQDDPRRMAYGIHT